MTPKMKTTQPVSDFICRAGILKAVVCSSLSLAEVKRRMLSEPCGTKAGWRYSETISPCLDNHKTHKHYLFNC